MKTSLRIAAIHCLLILVVWANFAWERETLPRAWVRTAPVDPYDPLRGRYVRLSLLPLLDPPAKADTTDGFVSRDVELYVQDGLLRARPAACCHSLSGKPPEMRLGGNVSYFIPENIPDPSRIEPGDQLWAEVSVPRRGSPRPLRLAVKSGSGQWRDISLQPR
ncbi:MAG: GDYXXLXY domain-containing protein [Bryobacter sp.]|jgi:hypothetical protein|nr:GDYXXLXY domain-containing protein [Bryobacter sp. CoA8 C33]